MHSAYRVRGLVLAAVVFAGSWTGAAEPGEVTIYRDNWGVPYIFAETDEAAAYGLGYAQAEDRLGDLYRNIRTALGTMSEAFGPDYIDQDYAMKLVGNAAKTEAEWADAPAKLKAFAESYMNGVQAYVAENPGEVPDWAVDLEPWQSIAVGKTMILRWPLGGVQDELENTQNSNGFGSNQWSVAPKRTASGAPILLTDPHLTWEGMAVFYEAHVYADELQMNGFFLVGSPVLALGHNDNVGWAATTGGPDTADIFKLKLNPDNPMQYEYDGEFRDAQVKFINIDVQGQDPVTRPAGMTHLGPLFSEPNYEEGYAYVGASPYFEEGGTRLYEQFYAMCKADNVDEFQAALGQNQFMEQNVMYADREGNIRYTRTGRVPIRAEGYDWSKAVPGHTSETAWKGIHPVEDLVGIKNPEAGYMQNCNISPANMIADAPPALQPRNYPDYVYNVSWDDNNTRGKRTLELLQGDDSITVEEAKAIAMDVHDILAEAWQNALEAAVDAKGGEYMSDTAFETAVERVLAWDGRFVKDSKAAPIIRFWRKRAQQDVSAKAIAQGESLNSEQQTQLLDALKETVAGMNDTYGGLDVNWGDIHKVGRNGQYFPCDGVVLGGGEWNTRTLFNVGDTTLDADKGTYVANSGSMSMCLMVFREEGIESYTCIPWGQSADPDSPHHMDQGEKLYSQRKFKKVHASLDELKPHVTSELVLEAE